MSRSLVPPFVTLGAVEGWLFLEATRGSFECAGQPGFPCVASWLVSVACFAVAAAVVGAGLTRARVASLGRFAAWIFGVSFGAIAVLLCFVGPVTRWDWAAVTIMPSSIGTYSALLFVTPFLVWRAAHARRGSLLGALEARGVWLAAVVSAVVATSFTSRSRGWAFDDKVGRMGPPNMGVRVELAIELVALVAMAFLVARDVGDALRVRRIDPSALVKRSGASLAILDLGVGDDTVIVTTPGAESYRGAACALKLVGDLENAKRTFERRVVLDAVVVVVGLLALLTFKVLG